MYMARIARVIVVPLGHKGYRTTLLPRYLLAGVLHDYVPIRHLQRFGIANVDLLLTGTGLALTVLDRHSSALQTNADRPHDFFFLGGLEDVIVLVVMTGSRQASVAAPVGRLKAVIEQVKLKFGCHEGLETHICQTSYLLSQHSSGRMGHFFMGVMIKNVAKY